MATCDKDCKNEERIRELETSQVEARTELRIHMRQINETVSDIKAVVSNLMASKVTEAEVKVIVRSVLDTLNSDSSKDKVYSIAMEALKVIAVIGGVKFLG
jgi:hypothetical protein